MLAMEIDFTALITRKFLFFCKSHSIVMHCCKEWLKLFTNYSLFKMQFTFQTLTFMYPDMFIEMGHIGKVFITLHTCILFSTNICGSRTILVFLFIPNPFALIVQITFANSIANVFTCNNSIYIERFIIILIFE